LGCKVGDEFRGSVGGFVDKPGNWALIDAVFPAVRVFGASGAGA
jgi:hypothetical protein